MGNQEHKIQIWAKNIFSRHTFYCWKMFQQKNVWLKKMFLAIFGEISDIYFLTIFEKRSKKTAVKSDQNCFFKKSGNSKFLKNTPWPLEISATPKFGGAWL